MIKRWILYLASLLGCIIFFAAYGEWVAWLILVMVAAAPFLSLALSVIPMLAMRPALELPSAVEMGQEVKLELNVKSPLPLLPFQCSLQLTHSLTGECLSALSGTVLPTEHCGQLEVNCDRFYILDLLGLFRFRTVRLPPRCILVRPVPITVQPSKDLERFLAHSWKPKPGGGFSEQHELRQYRPGDNLNQVHWKLSAKAGKLIIREPMIPDLGQVLLTMELSGSPDVLDLKFGRLLWMSRYLLAQQLPHQLRVLTGEGLQIHTVTDEAQLSQAVDHLLGCTPAQEVSMPCTVASWQYHIGGDRDEQ